MKAFKVSFSLRSFIIYFVILGALSWYLVNYAIERLNDGMRQSAESVMVDMSHLLAAEIEQQLITKQSENQAAIQTESIQTLFDKVKPRQIAAKIYQITKTSIDMDVYITNQNGLVIFDSSGKNTGADFSQWRDIRLTLEGEYGARTSFIDPEKTAEDDEKVMVVAAPIRNANDDIIGVLSVVKSISTLEDHLKTESSQLKNYAIILLLFALFIGYIFSIWFTKSLEKIAAYAHKLAIGKKAQQPQFWDNRLDNLSASVTKLRDQLDGKEYVENYIHSLTHELKTPLTSIRGAAELLQEELPMADREKFINNIQFSNNRMAQLVDKMLSLATLESQTAPLEREDFDLNVLLIRLMEERQALIAGKSLQIEMPDKHYTVHGDRMLIRQALANLLDNAIAFCPHNGMLKVDYSVPAGINNKFNITVLNQGEHIPDFALPRLYERFFSMPAEHNGNMSTAKSTGLGLSFVKEIMKHHQGSIQINNIVDSSLGHAVKASLSWPSKKN